MATHKTYDMARSNGREFYTEIAITPTFGRPTTHLGYRDIDALRAHVRKLRSMGFRRGKLLGGLDRAFRILAGLPVAEVQR